jgi:DNA end-binding protein Ku
MATRHTWEGFLQLSLITIPVRAFNAVVPGEGEIHFHQIHKGCGGRIRYKKVCEIHGEVTKDEVVSGYEYKKGQHVEVDPDEIADVRAKKDELIGIDTFIAPDKIDPIHLSGKNFYLLPTGPAGQKSYNLLLRVMQEKKRHAVASIVLSGHEERVIIRAMKNLLVMTVLYFDNQIKQPSEFSAETGESKLSAQELKLAASLVDASTGMKIDFSHFRDEYKERVKKLLDVKLKGKKMKTPLVTKAGPVINLMDALRRSLKKTGREDSIARIARRPSRTGRPHRKKAG